jgi:hypothetical protein
MRGMSITSAIAAVAQRIDWTIVAVDGLLGSAVVGLLIELWRWLSAAPA